MSRCLGDSALEGRIYRVVEEFVNAGSPITSDSVLQRLIARHREYARKPQLSLRKAVNAALDRATARLGDDHITAGEAPTDCMDAGNVETALMAQGEAGDPGFETQSASLNDTLYKGLIKPQESAANASAKTTEIKPAKPVKRKRPTEKGTDGQDGPKLRRTAIGPAPGDPNAASQWELPPYVRPPTRYADVGGLSSLLASLRQVVDVPLMHPELYAHLGVEPPRGVLLHGPPGVGKTLLARAIAGELGVYFRAVAGPELVGGLSGESENRLRLVFNDAATHAPAILFIDEIDAIAPKREGTSRGMERRMVAQLLACIDSLSPSMTGGLPVLVIGATNRPDSLDPGLRRAGRFDREIAVPIPDEEARFDILRVLTRDMRLATASACVGSVVQGRGLDLRVISRLTPGYVGADLASLAKEAAASAIDRVLADHVLLDAYVSSLGVAPMADSMDVTDGCGSSAGIGLLPPENAAGAALTIHAPLVRPFSADQLVTVSITHDDFVTATARVQPSALREGFATAPNVSWDDVGALQDVRAELEMAIVQPLRRPEVFASLGLRVPAGVMLYGPPGCGKTLLAKAIAAQSNANFISVKGPELLDKYVGESERAVRQVFQRARASAPCIVFFDELDSLAPRRGDGGGGSGSNVTERVVNQLLTELDGLDVRRDVFVVAATNRPDIIDPAMLRPGRLDKLLYVPLPTDQERAGILATHVRAMPLAGDVDICRIAADGRAERFSGADLAALAREAAVASLREFFDAENAQKEGSGSRDGAALGDTSSLSSAPASPRIFSRHFNTAFTKVQPSVSVGDERLYNAMRHKLRRAAPLAAAAESENVEGRTSASSVGAAISK